MRIVFFIETMMFIAVLAVWLRLGLKSLLAWVALELAVLAVAINLIAPLFGVTGGDYVVFCNDASFGARMSAHNNIFQSFTGHWNDLHFLGNEEPSSSLSMTALIAIFFDLICKSPFSPLATVMVLSFFLMAAEHALYWACLRWPPK